MQWNKHEWQKTWSRRVINMATLSPHSTPGSHLSVHTFVCIHVWFPPINVSVVALTFQNFNQVCECVCKCPPGCIPALHSVPKIGSWSNVILIGLKQLLKIDKYAERCFFFFLTQFVLSVFGEKLLSRTAYKSTVVDVGDVEKLENMVMLALNSRLVRIPKKRYFLFMSSAYLVFCLCLMTARTPLLRQPRGVYSTICAAELKRSMSV